MKIIKIALLCIVGLILFFGGMYLGTRLENNNVKPFSQELKDGAISFGNALG